MSLYINLAIFNNNWMKKIILTLLSLALAVILKLMLDLGLLKSVNPINSYADCKYLK